MNFRLPPQLLKLVTQQVQSLASQLVVANPVEEAVIIQRLDPESNVALEDIVVEFERQATKAGLPLHLGQERHQRTDELA